MCTAFWGHSSHYFSLALIHLNVLLEHLKSPLRWPEPIYVRVVYVFELRFSAGTVSPISKIFGIQSNIKKILFIFL